MRWPRESLSRKGRSGSNPDPGAFIKPFSLNLLRKVLSKMLRGKENQIKSSQEVLFPKQK